MQKIVYVDHAATTAVKKEVFEEMKPYFIERYGNPSAIYGVGTEAKEAIEEAREKVANALNAEPDEIYFTSGGSESDNLAIKGFAFKNRDKGNHIITSKIEHHAVLDSCKSLEHCGFKVTYLDVDSNGFVNVDELRKAITKDTILISIMFANNEIGTIEPIEEIGKIAKEKNITFHTDAVQAVGNVKIDVEKLNIDMLSISGHKLYAPKGIGVLYVKKGVDILKLQDGGYQESGKRAGTENVPGIVGIGKAIELAELNIKSYSDKLTKLRDYYISEVERKFKNVKLNGDRERRLPGNANITFEGVNGSKLLLNLSMKGVCASAGSACNTGTSDPSHVLKSIGLSDALARSSLRVTFGEENTINDVDYILDCLEKIITEKNM